MKTVKKWCFVAKEVRGRRIANPLLSNPSHSIGMKNEQRRIEKELFKMVYDWGRFGVVTDELSNAFQDKLEEYRQTLKQK